MDISSLGNKKNHFNHSQRGDIFYIGNGCQYYKRSIFANPFSSRIYGRNLAIENFRRKIRNTPRLWKALDDLEGKHWLAIVLLPVGVMVICCSSCCGKRSIAFHVTYCKIGAIHPPYLPSTNTRKPLTLSDVCSDMHHMKSKGVVRSHHRSSHGGHGLHVNPNYHLSPRDDSPFGTGEKRLCDGEVAFDLAVSNKRCLLRSP